MRIPPFLVPEHVGENIDHWKNIATCKCRYDCTIKNIIFTYWRYMDVPLYIYICTMCMCNTFIYNIIYIYIYSIYPHPHHALFLVIYFHMEAFLVPESLGQKFGLREKIRFKTFVTEVRPVGNGKRGWEVEFKDSVLWLNKEQFCP